MRYDDLITSCTREEIQKAVRDPTWQRWRRGMLGKTTERKIALCWLWLEMYPEKREARVQVSNYINALKRGGLL